MKKLIFIIVLLGLLLSCSHAQQKMAKINGVSFEAPSQEVVDSNFAAMAQVGSNWVSLMPYSFVREGNVSLQFGDPEWQWWGEKKSGIEACIAMAKRQGMKVLLKPHMWLSHGSFTGDLNFHKEEDWQAFEKSYSDYILKYAEVAQRLDAEMLCIGVEMKNMVVTRPEFWDQLIADVKKVYDGPLTYSANWNEYPDVHFWDRMDFIGVDAYFPLSDEQTPSVEDLKKGWEPIKNELRLFSEKNKKPILFTEYGYRSIDFCAKEPWVSYQEVPANEQAQVNAYQALFESVWQEDWYAGGFFWKWHAPNHLPGDRSADYTPQHKATMKVIRDCYSR